MNILVYNVAAEYAGALTILKNFYEEVVTLQGDEHNWYFVVSTDALVECENVKIIRIPWVKKSWIHRWIFDTFCAKKIVKKYAIDMVFSMQNIALRGITCPQTVYLQQSLQFSPVKYSFFKKQERNYWIRKNVICNMIKHSLKYADTIVVQTKWMRDATSEWLKNVDKRIEVVPPQVDIVISNEKKTERNKELFVYPAGDGIHKNHQLIIDACEMLEKRSIPYTVLFTLGAEDNFYTSQLYEQVQSKKLNIKFIGLLPHNEVLELYQQATLVFPSYIETFGLPLLEAKESGGFVLCADLPYGHEILDDYKNVKFFGVKNVQQLADYMEQSCQKSVDTYFAEEKEKILSTEPKKRLCEILLEIGQIS